MRQASAEIARIIEEAIGRLRLPAARVEGQLSGAQVAPAASGAPGVVDLDNVEPALGNPGVDGYVLSSTTAGVRSWVVNGSGGGFANPMTTAGDLIVGGVAGSAQRLGIGADGQVLTVSSGAPTWAAAGGGGATTLITSGTLGTAAATLTLSGISGAYRHLRLVALLRTSQAVVQSSATIYVNGDTTAGNYRGQRIASQNALTVAQNVGAVANLVAGGLIVPGASALADSFAAVDLTLYDYATSKLKITASRCDLVQATGSGNYVTTIHTGLWNSTAAITSITIAAGSGDLVAGTSYALYGVS